MAFFFAKYQSSDARKGVYVKFKKLVAIDGTRTPKPYQDKLSAFADETFFYYDYPDSDEEIIRRIGDADCVLVSWHTQIRGNILKACKNIKYVGMACSLYNRAAANVDIATADELGITVTGVRDYGDNGAIEYVISEIIRCQLNLFPVPFAPEALELTDRKIGIIGLGAMGSMLADRAMAFGAKVYYFNRTRKPKKEALGITYLPLDELLQTVDILSTHLPKNNIVLHEKEFKLFGSGQKILINVSLSNTFDLDVFEKWIKTEGNFCILDSLGEIEYFPGFRSLPNVSALSHSGGATVQSADRLSQKVIDNIIKFLENKQEK